MKTSKAVFLVFLSILSLCASNTQTVKSQFVGTIYIRSNGSVDPSTAPIAKTENVYTLTGDILGSITVETFNIVIDGAGYSIQGNGTGRGIQIANPYNATIKSSYDVTVKNFNVKGFEEGISVFGYWGNIISGVVVAGNNVTNNNVGIRFSSYYVYSNNVIVGNNITANDAGIEIAMGPEGGYVSGNTITGNQIADNRIGMRLYWHYSYYGGKPDPFQMNNTIYFNNFVNNSQNVVNPSIIFTPQCANIWDNGAMGNYWSNYNGTDADHDGIGDTPYIIDANNKDNDPLMKTVAVSQVLEPTPPAISIISPENNTYTINNVSLTFTLSKPTSWTSYSLDRQANVTIAGKTNLTGLSDGTHSLKMYAKAIFGKTDSFDIVYFTIDTTFPSISILSPENKTYDTNAIPLNFAVNEPASWVGYSLNEQANVTIAGNTTLTGLSAGSHNLTVYAKDTAGNTGISETIHFTVAQSSTSFPTTWIVAAIAIIAIGAVAFLVYFRRIRKTTGKAE